MEKIAVIYKSKYGSTKIYAQWLAEGLSADLLVTDNVKPADLQQYSTIVFGGGLYAGGVSGISLLKQNYDSIKDKSICLFTVGVSDVSDPANVAGIRAGIESALTPEMMQRIRIYHLRGGIYYSKMGLIHRGMMKMFKKMVSKKPESELRPEDKEMLQSFGRDLDFTNRAAIAPIVADVRRGQ